MLTLILLKYWNVLTTCYAMKKKILQLTCDIVITFKHGNVLFLVMYILPTNIEKNCSGCNPVCMFPKLLETLMLMV